MNRNRTITKSDAVEAIHLGATPAYVEQAYSGRSGVREFARKIQLDQSDLAALAVRWGIREGL